MNLDARPLAPGSHGDDVRHLHARLLDRDIAVAPGELSTGLYGPSTRAAVLQLQRDRELPATGVVETAFLRLLAGDGVAGHRYVVGRALGPDASAAAGVDVHAFDRDIRDEQRLGAATTDAEGFYCIRYDLAQARAGETGTADVFVRACLGDTILTDPPVEETRFNAPTLVDIAIHLPTLTPPALTEYERVDGAVEPLIRELGWADLREDGETRDIAFLHGETGLSATQIEHDVVAHRLAECYGGPPTFYYAIFATGALLAAGRWSTFVPRLHIGLDTSLRELLYDIALMSPGDVRRAVDEAVAGFVVPRDVLDEMDGIERLLASARENATDYLKTARQAALLEQVQDLIVPGIREQAQAILRKDPLGDLDGLLTRIENVGALIGESSAEARTRLTLADVLGNDGPTIDAVREEHGIAGPGDLHRLAALHHDDWVAAIRAGRATTGEDAQSAPTGGDAGEGRQATALVRAMESRFPTAAFAARLARVEEQPLPHAATVARLLSDNQEFDLASGNVRQLLADNPRSVAGGDGASVAAALRSAQRIFKLAPRFDQTAALLRNGVSSAATIAAIGPKRFMATALESGAFSPNEATRVFDAASDQHTASVLLAGQLATGAAATNIGALGSPPEKLSQVITDFPNMRTLFAQGDMCACEDCRSVHGASAYLVDALQFLKHRLVTDTTATPAVTLKAAKDVLFARRPDLGDVELSCTNTNTPMPYIDVVCELLEEAVAPDPGVPVAAPVATGIGDPTLVAELQAAGWSFTAASVVSDPDLAGSRVVRDAKVTVKLTPVGGAWLARQLHQTAGTEQEVAAAPEYVSAPAYAVLALSRFAFGLPFDLAHQETRRYFSQLDISRADVMRTLQAGGAPSDAAVAAERLGLSDAERLLVVTPDAAAQPTIWNTPGSPASATLDNVDAFVTRSAIDYEDLLELSTCRGSTAGKTSSFAAWTTPAISPRSRSSTSMTPRWTESTASSGCAPPPVGPRPRSIAPCESGRRRGDARRCVPGPDHRARAGPPAARHRRRRRARPVRATRHRRPRRHVRAGVPRLRSPRQCRQRLPPRRPRRQRGRGVRHARERRQALGSRAHLSLALGRSAQDTLALVTLVGAGVALTPATVSNTYALSRLALALQLTIDDLSVMIELTGIAPLSSICGESPSPPLVGVVRARVRRRRHCATSFATKRRTSPGC